MKTIYIKFLAFTFTLLAFATLVAQPANDACTGAQSITPNGSCVSGTTVSATDGWSSTVGCQSGNPNSHPEVWYTFVATGTTYVGSVTTSGSWAGNVEFTLASGTCAGGFTIVGSACGASPLSVNISGLTSGATYYFTVSNAASGTAGPFSVCSNTPAAACSSGQSCSAPTVITYTTGVQTCLNGCNTGAPVGPNFAGNNCYDFPNSTVWYQITTGASSATIDIAITSAQLTNPYFALFTTTNCILYTYSTGSCTTGSGGSASARVSIRPNTTYVIAISNANATQGNFNACFTVNNDNSVCNQTDQLSVTATSMGSPLSGPYQPGEQVTFCYTITNFQQANCNYLEGIVPTFGNCWDPVSFTAQGAPVTITTPLVTAGSIQPPSACQNTPSGTWSWFSAGAVTYNNIVGSLPPNTPLGAGWFFLSSYDPATGNCAPDPTDPDNSYGDSDFPSCGSNSLDWQVCFRLQARAAIACTNGQTDCSVSVKTYADGEVGFWNSIGCTADLPAVFSATLYCCTAPIVTASNTGPYCVGSTLQLNATGGATYSWSGPGGYTSAVQNPTRATATTAMSGTYTVTVTDASGCTATASTSVTVNANPTVAPTVAPAIICASANTTLAANATAGSGSISTYAWSSGLAGNVSVGIVSPAANTTYTVTVTNSNSCTASASVAVTVNAIPTAAPTVNPSVICNGDNATLAANATAGSGSISTYAWSSGLAGNVSGGTVTPSSSRTYTVTVTNSNSCTVTASVAITVNARPIIAPTASPTPICNGGSSTLAANATAGSGSITTYAWSAGIAGNVSGGTVTPTVTTVYIVTVTNTNSCFATAAVTVTVSANPTLAPSATPSSVCLGGSTTLAANATAGSGSITTYAWSSGLVGNVSGGSVSPVVNTTYTVTVTNSNSCTATASLPVTVNAVPTIAPTASPAIICNGGSTTLAANATAGSGSISTYAWSSGLVGNVSGGIVSPVVNTTYTVTVTNSNSCTATGSVAVTVNAKPTVAPTASPTVICNSGSTTLAANATAGSGSISTYAWSSGLVGSVSGGSVSPVANTTYTVTVTNSNSCTATASVAVTVSAIPTVAPTAAPAVICDGGSTTLAANATAGSGSISTYAWSSGLVGNVSGGSVSPTTNTTYTVTVTNSNSCTATASVAVTVNAKPTVAPNATSTAICNGGSTTLAANATAGSGSISTYAWSSGLVGNVSGGSVSPTANTTYTVTVTNSNSCTATASVAVIVNANPTVAPSATPSAICNGGSTTLAANATAGSGSISTYAWSSGLVGNVSGGSVSPTANTVYTVTVTNNNSCTATASLPVTVNAVPTLAPSAAPGIICTGGSTTLAANATAGSGSISTYAWNSGLVGNVSGGSVSPVVNTTYTVTVTNSNSCTATASIAVTVNAKPTVAPSATPTVICNGGSSTLAANATAGSGSISTYAWSSGLVGSVPGGSVSPIVNTTYTVTVTNSNSCTTTATVAVTVSAIPTVAPTATPAVICDGGNTTLAANATAGSGSISTYAWSSGLVGNVSGGSVSPTINTTYTVTVTNSNSCTATASVAVTVNSKPTVAPNATPTVICNGGSTTLAANATAGSGSISTYSWSSGLVGNVPGGSVSPIANTTYTVTVTNSNSCTASASVAVIVNANPTIAPNATPSAICNGGSTTLTANATAGSGTISTYAWSSGLVGNVPGGSVSPTANTVYTVTVTNSNSCTATASLPVTVNAVPTVAPTASPAIICNGGSTTLAANATAGSGSISTYAWSSGLVGNVPGGIVSPITNTTYTVTVTNSNSCTATASVAVTVNAKPTAAPTASPTVICNGESTMLAANATAGSGSISTYAWNNGLIGSISGGSVSPVVNTTYTVTVTNSNSCTATATISVTVNSLPSPSATNTGPYCAGGTIQLNSSGGSGYSWGGPAAFSSATQNPTRIGATVAMGGNYTVTVTGTNACTITASTNVVVNAIPAATATNTGPYCTTSTIQLSSGGGTSYSWSGPNAFASGSQNPTRPNSTLAMAGIYTVTVIDANTCSATASTNVIVNSSLSPIASNTGPSCVNGTIQLNVAGGNTYTWSGPNSFSSNSQNPTISNATTLMSGIYYVTASDLNGCSGTASTNVTVNTLPIPNASNTGPYCAGSTIQLNSSGGSTYSWSGVSGFVSVSQNPSLINSITGMSGIYTVTVTDINGCSAVASTTVTVNALPAPSISSIETSGFNNDGIICDGASVTLIANPTSGVTYAWANPPGGTTNNILITPASTTSYTVTVTNPTTACTAVAVITITVSPPPAPTIAITDSSGLIISDGTICINDPAKLTASPTTGLTYVWSNPPGGTANDIIVSPSVTTSYTVTVTSISTGCSASVSRTLIVNQGFTADGYISGNIGIGIGVGGGVYCNHDNLNFHCNVPGTSTYDYLWQGPGGWSGVNRNQVRQNVDTTMTGMYYITAWDVNTGCMSTDSMYIVIYSPVPPPALPVSNSPQCVDVGVTISMTGTPPSGMGWYWQTTPTGTAVANGAPSFTVYASGTYYLRAQNMVTGCWSDTARSIAVIVNPLPVPAISGFDTICAAQSTTLTASGGGTYVWSTGDFTPSITVFTGGVYSVTVTDGNSCSATASTNVVVNPLPVVNAGADATLTCAVTSVTLTATSITSGATFVWSNGTNGASNLVSVLNTYTVTVTDPANGCTASDQAEVNSNTSTPNVNAGADVILTCTTTSTTLIASSTTLGAIYLWSNGPATANNTVNVANTYTVTVTDPTNGCTVSDQAVVSSSSNLPNVNAGADETLTCNVTSVTLIATSTTPGVTFSWSNGINAASTVISASNIYTVTATNTSTGCAASDQVIVSANFIAPNVTAGPDASLTCLTTSATLIASSTTVGATFVWSNGTNTANNTVTLVNNYTVTATDPANGCTVSDQANVFSNTTAPDVNAGTDAILTCANTSVTLLATSATSGTIFIWSNGTNGASNLVGVASAYNVTVTDPANGCTASDQAIVSSNVTAPNVSTGPDETLTCVITSVTLTSSSTTSGATFLWSNGTPTANNSVSVANTYTVTVTDPNNGCTASASSSAIQNINAPDVSIAQPAELTCVITSVTLTASSTINGITYNWGSGIITSTNIVSSIGTYSVTATNPANNCSASTSTIVTENITIPTLSIAPPATLSCSVTSVTLSASSSAINAMYAWAGGGTSSTKIVNSAGSYFVTVTDAVNGCSTSNTVVVNSNSNLALSIITQDILCNGSSTGAIDLTVRGGSTPFVIQWDNGSTNEDLIGITAGDYLVTVTDNSGCIATSSASVIEPLAFSVSAIRNNVPCSGGNIGSIIISASGGTLPYNFTWNDGTQSQNRNFLSAGTYTLTVNDDNACTFSISMQITEPSPLSVIETHNDVLCNGGNTGSINLTTTGGTSPYIYSWSDGNNSPIRNNIGASNYSVLVTDSNSCSVTLAVAISEPAILSISETHADVLCNGAGTGSINITSSGGSVPHSFIWDDGSVTPVRNSLIAGSYSVTASDNNLCSVTAIILITEPTALVVSENHTDVLCNGDNSGSININASGGTSPIVYTWNDGNTFAIRNNVLAGNYTVTTSDNNACSVVLNIPVTEPTPITLTETHANVACSGGTGSIDITSGGGVTPRTYLWNDGITTEDRGSLTPANYSVTVSDGNLCIKSLDITIGSNSGIVVSETHNDVSCFGQATGNINVNVSGGISPYTYVWNDAVNAPNRINIPANNYTLSVYDNNSCIQILNVAIAEPPALSTVLSSSDVLCNGGNTGSINLTTSGGTLPYGFIWNDGIITDDRANLSVGNYTVTISDNNLCSSALTVNINEPTVISIAEVHSDVLCSGGSTGSITLTVSGGTIPYSFEWNDGGTSQNRANLGDGNYSVTVLDNHSCPSAKNIAIAEPSVIIISETPTDVICNGGNNGSITVSVTGGTNPYSFSWNDGITSQNRVNVPAGNYSVTVNDNNSCSETKNGIVITEPAAITLNEVHTNITCNGYGDGKITVSAAGGTSPYTFVWNDGTTSPGRVNLSAGNYFVTANDSRSCPVSINVVITEPSGAVLATFFANPTCESMRANGNITLNASGGSSPFGYRWSNGSTANSLLNIGPGNYAVTVNDANGCEVDTSFALVYQYDFSIDASPDISIGLGESATLGYTIIGNAGNFVNVWAPASTLSCSDCSAPNATPNSTTTYQIQITNEVGCAASSVVTVSVEPDHTVFIPNVFTPNNDGNNDVFEIYGKLKGLVYLEVQVFNRWGEKVFESQDHHFKWDGTYQGVMQNPSVFVWQLKLVWLDGHMEELRNGTVTLIK